MATSSSSVHRRTLSHTHHTSSRLAGLYPELRHITPALPACLAQVSAKHWTFIHQSPLEPRHLTVIAIRYSLSLFHFPLFILYCGFLIWSSGKDTEMTTNRGVKRVELVYKALMEQLSHGHDGGGPAASVTGWLAGVSNYLFHPLL